MLATSLLKFLALALSLTTTFAFANTYVPLSDGRHTLRFHLLSCPPTIRPKISGFSSSSTPSSSLSSQFSIVPNSTTIIVPSDFIGSIYLAGEQCGKYGDSCQSLDLTFQPNPNETVRSYINYDAMPGKKFVYPVKAWFDDGGEQKKGEDGVIECEQSSCVDGSRDPDDFISNRIYSSTKGVGVVVEYDCAGRLNGTSTTH
ncbi:hypothetical protein NDA18_003236 [Ustilago nuda]|nr:hypothetical protein NDA18_003236 [Ustilago nuda]